MHQIFNLSLLFLPILVYSTIGDLNSVPNSWCECIRPKKKKRNIGMSSRWKDGGVNVCNLQIKEILVGKKKD